MWDKVGLVSSHGNHRHGCYDAVVQPLFPFAARQRSEQNLTLAQSRSHFLRQAKGRWQDAQILVGRFSFLCAMACKRPNRHYAAAVIT